MNSSLGHTSDIYFYGWTKWDNAEWTKLFRYIKSEPCFTLSHSKTGRYDS